MNGGNSVYLILPFVALWAVAPLFENGVAFTVCLAIAALGFVLLAVRDFLDERRTNPSRKHNKEEEINLSSFESEMIGKQKAPRKVKAAALVLLLAEIAGGFLSLTVEGMIGKIGSLICCLLPMLTLALYLTHETCVTIIEPESGFAGCGFGRIFGREKVCLLFHFGFAAGIWILWMVTYQRGITLLDRTKWLTISFGIAVLISSAFLIFSKEYRSHRIIVPLAVAMALANVFAFVWVVNVQCDAFPSEANEVVVTDTHLEERIRSIGAHYEDYLTVRFDDGSLLDLYEPYDFDYHSEGDRLTVICHRGVLGIEWAE